MPCPERRESLSAYVDGELEASHEKFLVESHLQACVRCREHVRLLGLLKDAVREVQTPPMPMDLKTALRARASAVESRKTPALSRAAREFWSGLSAWPRLRYALASGLVLASIAGVVFYQAAGGEPVPIEVLLAAHSRYRLTLPSPQKQPLERLSSKMFSRAAGHEAASDDR